MIVKLNAASDAARILNHGVDIANGKYPEKLTALLARFKSLSTPVISRVENNKIWLDLRSLANIEKLLTTLKELSA